jgi:hypothetical protein
MSFLKIKSINVDPKASTFAICGSRIGSVELSLKYDQASETAVNTQTGVFPPQTHAPTFIKRQKAHRQRRTEAAMNSTPSLGDRHNVPNSNGNSFKSSTRCVEIDKDDLAQIGENSQHSHRSSSKNLLRFLGTTRKTRNSLDLASSIRSTSTSATMKSSLSDVLDEGTSVARDLSVTAPRPKKHVSFNPVVRVVRNPLQKSPMTDDEKHACWWSSSDYSEIRADARRVAQNCFKSSVDQRTVSLTLESTYDLVQETIEEFTETSSISFNDEYSGSSLEHNLYDMISGFPARYASGLVRWCQVNDGRRGLEKQLLGNPSTVFAFGTTGARSSYARDIRSIILMVSKEHGSTPEAVAEAARWQSLHSRLYARLAGFADEAARSN